MMYIFCSLNKHLLLYIVFLWFCLINNINCFTNPNLFSNTF